VLHQSFKSCEEKLVASGATKRILFSVQGGKWKSWLNLSLSRE